MAIPAFKDNYIWCVVNTETKSSILIDPGDAEPVFKFMRETELHLEAILVTHHHHDHTGGVAQLKKHFSVPVYGPQYDDIPSVDNRLHDSQSFTLPKLDMRWTAMHIPGHTLGHIAFYSKPFLFCGDTLFSAGCGRIFEGSVEQMVNSLQKLADLPEETLVYCGHEYTEQNLLFAAAVEPSNQAVLDYQNKITTTLSVPKITLPTTIRQEKDINPFLRCDKPTVQNFCQQKSGLMDLSAVQIFGLLRTWKNTYK